MNGASRRLALVLASCPETLRDQVPAHRWAEVAACGPFVHHALGRGCGAFDQVGGLRVSTSRTGLVTSPHQERLFNYHAAFGRSELAVLVVSGETAEDRRQFVDRFESELAKLPEFERRVLGKVTLDTVAETLLVWRPELAQLLPKAAAALEPGVDPGSAGHRPPSAGFRASSTARKASDDASPKPLPEQAVERARPPRRRAEGSAAGAGRGRRSFRSVSSAA